MALHQKALSQLRLNNDDNGSQVVMDDSGAAPRFQIGTISNSSSNDSVTSANSRGGASARRSRAQMLRSGRRQQQGTLPATTIGQTAPVQPMVANVYHVTAISVVDPHGDHGLYTGSISSESGMPHGFGRFEFLKGGRWYEGVWERARGGSCFLPVSLTCSNAI